jgi:hypothetical protein
MSNIPEWAPSMALYSHLVNKIGGEAGLVLRHQSNLSVDWSALEEGTPFFYLDWVHNSVRGKLEAIASNGLVVNFAPMSDVDDQQEITIDRAKAVHCETIFRRWLATPDGIQAIKAYKAKTDIVTVVTYQ